MSSYPLAPLNTLYMAMSELCLFGHLLELLVSNPDEIFDKAKDKEMNCRQGKRPLTNYFKVKKKKKGLQKDILKYYLNEDKVDLNKFRSDESEEESSEEIVVSKKNKKKLNKLFLNLCAI